MGVGMISIVGTLEAGEAQGTLREIRNRTHGRNFGPLMFAISLAIGIAAGLGSAVFFDDIIHIPNLAWPACFVVIAIITHTLIRIFRKWSVKRYRHSMQLRGMPTNFSYKLSLADNQLSLETQWAQHTAPWSSVTEIFRSGNYWIFLIGLDPWFAPSRLFSSADDERNFIAMALRNLSRDARERSPDAVAFAGP